MVLIPAVGDDGALAAHMAALATRRELAGGSWDMCDHQGLGKLLTHPEQDDVVMVEVVTDTLDRAGGALFGDTRRTWFQEKIHGRAVPVEMLDVDEK